jgi:uncharacterized repeat protein (TIGR03803 family)
MSKNTVFYRRIMLALAFLAAPPIFSAAAATETVLYSFKGGADGALPLDGLVADSSGALYGTTTYGGKGGTICGCGTVFKLTPPSKPGAPWTRTILHAFKDKYDGQFPGSGLTIDRFGTLYGTTELGGSGSCPGGGGCGTVFKLTPPGSGQTVWTEKILYNFKGAADGGYPRGVLIEDGFGELYGTTRYGGGTICSEGLGCGTVFRLTPPGSSGRSWTETVLYAFTGGSTPAILDAYPESGVIMDAKGALYGTTTGSGTAFGFSTAFKLTPPASGQSHWTETVLHAFKGGSDGIESQSGLAFGPGGVLYGATVYGGTGQCQIDGVVLGCGVVYSLAPPAKGQTAWTETILHTFTGGDDGANSYSPVLVDAHGALYGTTVNGGSSGCMVSGVTYGCGAVFRLARTSVGTWSETVLYSFPDVAKAGSPPFPAGANPSGNLIADGNGTIYGTAEIGGSVGSGTVYALTGSKFVPR